MTTTRISFLYRLFATFIFLSGFVYLFVDLTKLDWATLQKDVGRKTNFTQKLSPILSDVRTKIHGGYKVYQNAIRADKR